MRTIRDIDAARALRMRGNRNTDRACKVTERVVLAEPTAFAVADVVHARVEERVPAIAFAVRPFALGIRRAHPLDHVATNQREASGQPLALDGAIGVRGQRAPHRETRAVTRELVSRHALDRNLADSLPQFNPLFAYRMPRISRSNRIISITFSAANEMSESTKSRCDASVLRNSAAMRFRQRSTWESPGTRCRPNSIPDAAPIVQSCCVIDQNSGTAILLS